MSAHSGSWKLKVKYYTTSHHLLGNTSNLQGWMMSFSMVNVVFVFQQCQANIKSYFLCMTESDQRVKILRNQDGTPRNFTVRWQLYMWSYLIMCAVEVFDRSMNVYDNNKKKSDQFSCVIRLRRETPCTSPPPSPVLRSRRGVHPGNAVATRGR